MNKVFSHLESLNLNENFSQLINFAYSKGYKIDLDNNFEIIHAHGFSDGATTVSEDTNSDIGVMLPRDSNGDAVTELSLPSFNEIDAIYPKNITSSIVVYGQTLNNDQFSKVFPQELDVTQNVIAYLDTPLARVWKIENTGTGNWDGSLSAFNSSETSTTNGYYWSEPDKVFLTSSNLSSTDNNVNTNQAIRAGYTVPHNHILLFKKVFTGMNRASNSNFLDAQLQIKEFDKTFKTQLLIPRQMASNLGNEEYPFVIAPPNSDVKLIGQVNNATGAETVAGFVGFLIPILEEVDG